MEMRFMRNCIGMTLVLFLLLLVGCSNQSDVQTSEGTAQEVQYYNQPLPKNERQRVLVLHSYHKEYAWIQDVNKGILSGFAEERFLPDRNITIEYFYMDTKRQTSETWKRQVAQQAMQKISDWKPDVVIATDDNAQKYVVSKMKDSGVNFVFLGVNADPMTYGYIQSPENPGGTITGAIERARFEESVSLLRRLTPNVHKIAIVCDDGPTGKPIIERVMAMAPEIGVEIVSSQMIGKFSQWKK